jgi:hypothetical protein
MLHTYNIQLTSTYYYDTYQVVLQLVLCVRDGYSVEHAVDVAQLVYMYHINRRC